MKQLRLVRFLPWLLLAVCPPLFQCGGAVEHGTETGNPPVVEQQKLHVVLHDDGVLVVADPGAVPAGATVSVSNVRSGDRSDASAGADGSVSVSVPGTLADEYEVTVSSGGRSQTVRVSASSGAGGADLASASCESLGQSINDQVAAGYASASKACQADSDCTTGGDFGCFYTCNGPILSREGEQAAQQSLLESTAPLCAELTRRCPSLAIRCPSPVTTVGCNDGICQALSCEDLQSRILQRLSDIQEQAPRDCTVDADCTLISTQVRCLGSCGRRASVQAVFAEQTTQLVKSAEETICGQYQVQSCRAPAPPPCPQQLEEPRAACVSGKCDIGYAPVP